jgi:3-hydroxyacyl-[acyl-carrier-protein] dehydratase
MRFYLIDRITRWELGVAAEAVKNIALSEVFFEDLFPRRPVMPGVLIIEGMAQLAALLLEAGLQARSGRSTRAVLSALERTKFRAMGRPGDSLRYRVEVLSFDDAGGRVRAEATRGEELVAATEMTFDLKPSDDPALSERRRKLMELWIAP